MEAAASLPLVAPRALAGEVRKLLEQQGRLADLSGAVVLADRVAQARETLAAALRSDSPQESHSLAAMCEDLTELTELTGALNEHIVAARLESVANIHDALARLRTCTTVSELLTASVRELAVACRFDRTAVSRLRGSTWRAEAIYMTPDVDPEFSMAVETYLTSHWQPLGPGALETDLIRRRAAAVIAADDPRMQHEWLAVAGSTGYVAAPVMPSGRVIGFLQADCYASQRTLDMHDRDNMWTFAEGFGLLFERTVLLERLETQRSEVREALARAESQFDSLAGDEVKLVVSERRPDLIAGRAADFFRRPATEPVGQETLTVRERNVLELMATGSRNSEIADRLAVTEATVKSHVKSVFRKLGVTNRAEAVSRHLQLTLRRDQ